MAKNPDAKPKASTEKSSKGAAALKAAADAERPKYGIEQLEDATGLAPTSIRVALRDSPFVKTGRFWGWNTKAEFDQVVKWFKDRTTKAEPKTPKAAKKAA